MSRIWGLKTLEIKPYKAERVIKKLKIYQGLCKNKLDVFEKMANYSAVPIRKKGWRKIIENKICNWVI